MERYVRCMHVPGFRWETYVHYHHGHLPGGYALFFRWNNFIPLSRQGLHCCNHIYVSCKGFHNCKNISQVSVNHLVQGVSLRRVVGKRVLYPFPGTSKCCWIHSDGSGCRTSHVPDWHLKVSVGHICIEFVVCWKQRNQFWSTSHTLAHSTFSGVPCQLCTFSLTITCCHCIAISDSMCG